MELVTVWGFSAPGRSGSLVAAQAARRRTGKRYGVRIGLVVE